MLKTIHTNRDMVEKRRGAGQTLNLSGMPSYSLTNLSVDSEPPYRGSFPRGMEAPVTCHRSVQPKLTPSGGRVRGFQGLCR